ncbi:MAG: DUF1641 domain-containing protein [Enhygromyxa sp.]
MSQSKPPSIPGPEIFAARSVPTPVANQLQLLQRIDARLERIEDRLAKLDPLIDAVPGLLAMAGDTLDDLADELGELDERVRGLVALAERVTRPATLAQLHALFDLLDGAPGLLAMAGDSLDELANEAAARGIPIEQIIPELGRAFASMLQLLTSTQVKQLLDSDLLLPGAIAALGNAARAMASAACAPESEVGLWKAMSMMREPEVKRAVGFALEVARRFGSDVEQLRLPISAGDR